MNTKYNFLKLIVGTINIGYFIHHALISGYAVLRGPIWKYIVVAVVLFFVLMKWVSFIKGNESIWAFIVTLVVTVPLNIRLDCYLVNDIYEFMNPVLKIMYGCVIYLSVLAVEEIGVGIITRLIWRRQNEL